VAALSDPALEAGALLALEHLPANQAADEIRAYAQTVSSRAMRYHQLRYSLHLNGDERTRLLADSLYDAAQRYAVFALHAIGLLGDRAALTTAIENLTSREPNQRANAIETLESIGDQEIVKPLLAMWETSDALAAPASAHVTELLNDPDDWLRACATLVLSGGVDMHTLPTLTLMERVLFLRRVSLFAELAPIDLKHIATLAGERLFHAGDLIAQQGEPGDEMFIIVSGRVAVREGTADRSERAAGDVVGEMSIITHEPRLASLIAVEPVRVLSLDRRAFEGMLRDRPEISLAVMRVLIARLKESEAKVYQTA
jgi:hypothetical protein